MSKTKIVLDADVIIHFSKGGRLHELANIFPQYEYVVLSTVYDEVLQPIKNELDNILNYIKSISLETFSPQGEMKKEYAILKSKFGKGESACMSYCKFTNNVIGSSNIRDIKDFCETNKITYLTTLDFLYFSIKKGMMNVEDANDFCKKVVEKGSRLPSVDFRMYVSSVVI